MVDDVKEKKEAIDDTIVLIANSGPRLLVSSEVVLRICKACPEYALDKINRNRLELTVVAEVAELVRSVEWELLGPNRFIATKPMLDLADAQFVCRKVVDNAHCLSRQSIHKLLRELPGHLRTKYTPTLLNALSQKVTTFADSLTAELPGLSKDVEALKSSITDYGFGEDLNEALTKIDESIAEQSDGFDVKATMGHIRSFFEKLHKRVAEELARQKPESADKTPLEKCGKAIEFLARKGVLTPKFEQLGKALYGILSDDEFGVHAIKATCDYSRLCRNIVVEYAVTLLFELERRLAEPGNE